MASQSHPSAAPQESRFSPYWINMVVTGSSNINSLGRNGVNDSLTAPPRDGRAKRARNPMGFAMANSVAPHLVHPRKKSGSCHG